MAKKQLSDYEKVEAVIYAEIAGDEAASERFKVSRRSIRNYKTLCAEEGSELSKTFRAYVEALQPQARAESFLDFLNQRVAEVSDIIVEKARGANDQNPMALRVMNEHVIALLDHKLGLEYITRLLPVPVPEPTEADGYTPYEEVG